ncbi:hypothetical protein B0H63DRAFT_147874 [Podospora didyma]|uniref:DUF2293 domain-containing protein n=1 Tax=Podospora didyma TaxID=330526 RepID=A0AAE0NSV2_9PEZI|nr:hypothetical protein B0H63DRAFT_147874 [Podospora didyma]
MGKQKSVGRGPGAPSGSHAKERHVMDRRGNLHDWSAPLPPDLRARRDLPKLKTQHKSWFEFVENKEKKKKLEYEITTNREPPPGFEFVPVGNPSLTTACKEISREQGAMIFIVTSTRGGVSQDLSLHLNRIGHHIRQSIADEARESLGDDEQLVQITANPGSPEPIPVRQEDINRQADAALKDLFPRIPNTDRQMIIEHAFNKSNGRSGPVGLAPNIPLSRRVQLAVLAHIRHTHTRYDELLRETTWGNARRAVEPVCLDVLVKWRGDEENGRDELDEILREVIVISDSESDDDGDDDGDDDDGEDESSDASPPRVAVGEQQLPRSSTLPPSLVPVNAAHSRTNSGQFGSQLTRKRKKYARSAARKSRRLNERAAKRTERGLDRAQAAWQEAVDRQRLQAQESAHPAGPVVTERPASHAHLVRPAEPEYTNPGFRGVQSSGQPPHHTRQHSYGTSLQPVAEVYQSNWERQNYANYGVTQQQTASPSVFRLPQENRMPESTMSNGFRPINESRIAFHTGTNVERVRHDNQDDLKDHLVKSIEPASPASSHFPAQFSSQLQLADQPYHTEGNFRGMRANVESLSRSYKMPSGEASAAQGHQVLRPRDDFVILPPRYETTRASARPGPRPEPTAMSVLQPRGITREYDAPPSPGSLGQHYLPPHRNSVVTRENRPTLGPVSRPIWIGDNNLVLRSEDRPILIPDSRPPSQLMTHSSYPHSSVQYRPQSASTRNLQAMDAKYVHAEDRGYQYIDSSGDRHIESKSNDFVEIVRVSNRFPRRHEPDPVLIDSPLYERRPKSTDPEPRRTKVIPHEFQVFRETNQEIQEREAASSELFRTTAANHEVSTNHQVQGGNPPRPHFISIPFGRAESVGQAAYRENTKFGIPRHPVGYSSNSQRQERVVGIEYAQPRQLSDTHALPERIYDYDNDGDRIYTSRGPSQRLALPVNDYQALYDRSIQRRDEIITID